MAGIRAITFDFNGTLSDDEPVLCELFRELFAERGRPLTAERYYAELSGLSDEAIVTAWLGEGYPAVEETVRERIRRYRERADGSTIGQGAREAVRYAAARVPVGIVSGAALEEILPVVDAAGLAELLTTVISADAVERGKPAPESYERALAALGVPPEEAVAFEDTEAGIAAAKGAGMRCVAVRGTQAHERLAAADELVDRLELSVVRRLV